MPPAHEASATAGEAMPGLQQRMQQTAAVLPVCTGGKCPADESDQSVIELS